VHSSSAGSPARRRRLRSHELDDGLSRRLAASSRVSTIHEVRSRPLRVAASRQRACRSRSTFTSSLADVEVVSGCRSARRRRRSSLRDHRPASARSSQRSCSSRGSAHSSAWWWKLNLSRRRDNSTAAPPSRSCAGSGSRARSARRRACSGRPRCGCPTAASRPATTTTIGADRRAPSDLDPLLEAEPAAEAHPEPQGQHALRAGTRRRRQTGADRGAHSVHSSAPALRLVPRHSSSCEIRSA
jgi:hypothetical protein